MRLLRLLWSPRQIAAHLAKLHPSGSAMRVSHETIYNTIYAQPRGELRRELIACQRMARAKRWPRSRGEDRRGHLSDLLSIHVRPPEVADRQFPGHWEGDLIKGAGNASAVEFVVESAQAAAARVIHEHEAIRLSQAEQIAFVTALLNPAAPNDRLRSAAANYRQQLGV